MKDGKLKLKRDPKKDPYFNEKVKMCTVETDTGEKYTDGFPIMDISLKFCPINSKCCGIQDNDEDGNPIDQGDCCNKE